MSLIPARHDPDALSAAHGAAAGAADVDSLYAHPALYDALLPVGAHLAFYAALARRQAGAVLALACGTGQLAVPIAAAGHPTVGLDRSAPMLAAARHRAAAAGVDVAFVEGDMRGFDLGRRFALVFVARNALLHCTATADLVAALAAARRHLAPGGVLAFDVFSPDVGLLARPRGERAPVIRVHAEAFGELTVEGADDYDAAAQVNRATWYVSTPDRRDAWVLPLHLRCVFPQELPLLVERAGLRLAERYGDFAGAPFGAGSARQVCVCAPA